MDQSIQVLLQSQTTESKLSAVKNTLFEKAVRKAINTDAHKLALGFPLKKNTAVIFFKENWSIGLKAVSEFIKKEESITFKFGVFDSTFFKANEVKVLATLPSKTDFIGKFVYLFKSPVSRTVFAGKFPMMALVNVLKAKAAKTSQEFLYYKLINLWQEVREEKF